MYIEEIRSGDTLQINVEGRIDSNTSNEFQETVLNSFQRCTNLVISMEKVSFISSACLRTLILGSKAATAKGGQMTVTGVTPEVMEVFRTTGMDSLLNIK